MIISFSFCPPRETCTFFSASSVSLSWLPTCTFTSRGQCEARADRDRSPSCLHRYAVYFCSPGQWDAREHTPWSWTPRQSEMLISVTFCRRDAIFTSRSSLTWDDNARVQRQKAVYVKQCDSYEYVILILCNMMKKNNSFNKSTKSLGRKASAKWLKCKCKTTNATTYK